MKKKQLILTGILMLALAIASPEKAHARSGDYSAIAGLAGLAAVGGVIGYVASTDGHAGHQARNMLGDIGLQIGGAMIAGQLGYGSQPTYYGNQYMGQPTYAPVYNFYGSQSHHRYHRFRD